MKKSRRYFSALCAATFAMVASAGAAQAASKWPEKPVHLLVGFAPGGPTDVVARILSEEMSKALGQPVIVENKAGAAGNIAAVSLTQAPADGYTLLYNTSRSEEHTSELQSRENLVCRLLLEKKKP